MKIGLKLQQFVIKHKHNKIEIRELNDKFQVIVKSPQKTLFGRIILRPEKIILTRNIEKDKIDYVEEYKEFAFKCFNENPANNRILDLLNLTLALNTEAGEYGDIIKKAIFFSKPIKKSDLCDELGDIAFYLFNTLTFLDLDLKDVLLGNVIKINERYPNGRQKNFAHNVRNKREEKKKIDEFFENINKNDDVDIALNK